ncbi:MAG: hypothetical protein AAGK78_11960, partial [Planctomycetota bacterium]
MSSNDAIPFRDDPDPPPEEHKTAQVAPEQRPLPNAKTGTANKKPVQPHGQPDAEHRPSSVPVARVVPEKEIRDERAKQRESLRQRAHAEALAEVAKRKQQQIHRENRKRSALAVRAKRQQRQEMRERAKAA